MVMIGFVSFKITHGCANTHTHIFFLNLLFFQSFIFYYLRAESREINNTNELYNSTLVKTAGT